MKALIIAALAAASLIFTPTASADAIDNYIHSVGTIPMPQPAPDKVDDMMAITIGLAVCVELLNGKTPAYEIDQLTDELSEADAQAVLSAAVENFCPTVKRTWIGA